MYGLTKRLSAIVCASALLLTATACSANSGGEPGAPGGENVPVRLVTGVDPSYAAIYVADQEGLFDEEGVDVEITMVQGGAAMGEAITAGEADLATMSESTSVTLMGSNPDLTAVFEFQRMSEGLKVVWGPNVKSASDIRKVAAVPGGLRMAVVRYLESEGVDPSTVEFIQATPPDIPVMFTRGEVDATVIFQPWGLRVSEDSDATIVGTNADFDLEVFQWLIADGDWLEGHEEEVRKIARALDKANLFMQENPDETYEIIEKAIKLAPADTKVILEDLILEARDIDESRLAVAKETAQFFVDDGTLKEMPDLENQIRLNFLGEDTVSGEK